MFARFQPNTEAFSFPPKQRGQGLSVIICCYNSAPVIVPTVQALSAQVLGPNIQAEIIVVDNNCSDNTLDLIKEHYTGKLPLQIISEARPGLMYARIAGILESSYDLLQFVDDDNILQPGYLERCVHWFRTDSATTIIGGLNIGYPQQNLPHWFGTLQHIYACGPRSSQAGIITDHSQAHFFGAGLAFRAQAIEKAIGGPPPPFTVGRTRTSKAAGDDLEIARRIFFAGGQFRYDPEMKLYHNIAWNSQRLSWPYIREVTKGGGLASLPLAMYAELHHHGVIQGWGRAVLKGLNRLGRLLWRNKMQPWIFFRGTSDVRRRRVFLTSRLGALIFGGRTYLAIRRQLLDHFGNNSAAGGGAKETKA